MRFEGEEVKVVALGTSWVAAITSLNFLRIFTEGGLQVCSYKNFIYFAPSLVIFYKGITFVRITLSLLMLVINVEEITKNILHN